MQDRADAAKWYHFTRKFRMRHLYGLRLFLALCACLIVSPHGAPTAPFVRGRTHPTWVVCGWRLPRRHAPLNGYHKDLTRCACPTPRGRAMNCAPGHRFLSQMRESQMRDRKCFVSTATRCGLPKTRWSGLRPDTLTAQGMVTPRVALAEWRDCFSGDVYVTTD